MHDMFYFYGNTECHENKHNIKYNWHIKKDVESSNPDSHVLGA